MIDNGKKMQEGKNTEKIERNDASNDSYMREEKYTEKKEKMVRSVIDNDVEMKEGKDSRKKSKQRNVNERSEGNRKE